jgi:acetyltransferase
LRGPRRILTDRESKEILRTFGIPIVEESWVHSAEEGLAAAHRLSYPVVMKGQSPEIPHKTEAGLVQLNIRDEKGLRDAYDRIVESARRYKSGVRLEGILIQEMMPKNAAEVILGISRDPSFGPVVVFGLGGTWVELLKDTALRIPPVDPEEARAMISEIKGKSVLEGFRGSEGVDVDSLVQALVQVGRMAVELREVLISLDLNPLMAFPGRGGVRVVDVVMEVGDF